MRYKKSTGIELNNVNRFQGLTNRFQMWLPAGHPKILTWLPGLKSGCPRIIIDEQPFVKYKMYVKSRKN